MTAGNPGTAPNKTIVAGSRIATSNGTLSIATIAGKENIDMSSGMLSIATIGGKENIDMSSGMIIGRKDSTEKLLNTRGPMPTKRHVIIGRSTPAHRRLLSGYRILCLDLAGNG